MHILLTGAGSFIGRHLTYALSRADVKITATYRSENSAIMRLRTAVPDVEFVCVDLAKEVDFASLPERIDRIVHVAGVSASNGVEANEILACNVAGALHLLRYARRSGATGIIVASTLSVHGMIEEDVVTETTPIREPDVYGASKYLAERLFAAESHWLPCAAIRLPGVLGPGAHRAWIPSLLKRMKVNEDVTIYRKDSAFNNAAHVDDISELVRNMLQSRLLGFHAFPIGAAGQMKVGELVQELALLTGSKTQVTEKSPVKRAFTISSRYAEDNFGYKPMRIDRMIQRYVSESQS